MSRWATLVICVGWLGCSGDRLVGDTPIDVAVPPAVEVAAPALMGWAVVNERARIALTPAGPVLAELGVWLQMYGHRVPVLEATSDRVRIIVNDGRVQLEVWVPMADLWRVTSRQTHLYDSAEEGVTFGFLTAGTEVTVMETGKGTFDRISAQVDDIRVEGYVRASDVGQIYQPARVELAGFTSTSDFRATSTSGHLLSGQSIYADVEMTRPVTSLVHIGKVKVALFHDDLVTLVAPQDEVESFPRMFLEVSTREADVCMSYAYEDRCFQDDPWPTLRNDPLGYDAQPLRCVPSRMPTHHDRRAWVAPPRSCVWHESMRAPVGMVLEPTTIRPTGRGRASLVDTPHAADGFFIRTE